MCWYPLVVNIKIKYHVQKVDDITRRCPLTTKSKSLRKISGGAAAPPMPHFRQRAAAVRSLGGGGVYPSSRACPPGLLSRVELEATSPHLCLVHLLPPLHLALVAKLVAGRNALHPGEREGAEGSRWMRGLWWEWRRQLDGSPVQESSAKSLFGRRQFPINHQLGLSAGMEGREGEDQYMDGR